MTGSNGDEQTEIEVVEEFRGYERTFPKAADWIRLLARLGTGDLHGDAAESRADELELDGRGFGELANLIEQRKPGA